MINIIVPVTGGFPLVSLHECGVTVVSCSAVP